MPREACPTCFFLSQDLDRLHAAIERGASKPEALLETAAECLGEAKRIGISDVIAQTLLQQGRIRLSAQTARRRFPPTSSARPWVEPLDSWSPARCAFGGHPTAQSSCT